MAVKIAEEWLANCGGCEVTILDIGEPLLDLLPQLEFVHIPVLTDNKYFGHHKSNRNFFVQQSGDDKEVTIDLIS